MLRESKDVPSAISFTLNGTEINPVVDPDRSLLKLLREDCGIISPKNGCEPQAQCGCCTVWVNEKPRLSCTMKASQVVGKNVTTLEGLCEEKRDQISDAFVRCGAVQCGFCIPGFAARGVSIVDNNPSPSRDDITSGLRANLCRCTGYTKIVDAIELYAKMRRGEDRPRTESESCGGVGTALPKYLGRESVLGERKFIDDITVPGMLRAACLFSDHPRALVEAIDTAPAEKVPGVHRVITATDVPGDRYIGLITQDWPILVAIGEETRCVGDILAVVVADTDEIARDAVEQIAVSYEVRAPVTSPQDALKPDAPKIHPKGNLLSKSSVKLGDTKIGFADSTHIVEHTFSAQRIEHLFLEPESCIAAPIPTGLRVWTPGQGVFDDRRQIAKVLGLPVEKIEVELVPNGGAFGGKEDMSVQAQTSLAAHLCGVPVKMVLTRPESFRLHPKRHPIDMVFKVGCDDEGKLTAVHARMIGDKGAYASVGAKVLERAAGHACGPYKVAHVDVEALAVYTNNPPCGAMRGFGANQSSFAIETCMDMLAEKIGIDGWEMRWRNILRQGDTFATGQKLDKPFGLEETLLAVKEQYRAAKYAGIACGIKNVGIGNGMPDLGKCCLTIEDDETITIRTGFTEMGQGLFTVCVQFAVEVTGLPPKTFNVQTDTSRDLDCGQTTASRGTVLAGNAIIDAGTKLKAALESGKTLADLKGQDFSGYYACEYTTKLGADVENPRTHLTYGFATQVAILNDDGTLKKFIAAHDVGKAINPQLLQGQIEGSVHMGLGYALTEDFVCEEGQIQMQDINACGVLRAHHMPEVEVIIIEVPDPECPFGAKGVGEIGLVPTAGAVAGALYKFDKTRRFKLPMKEAPASRAIWDKKFKPTPK
ncbi:MAG: selenium-dependent xanthine dehydrogenase [Planctomycetes bacterium]|nr:selenium-dependent xanthine dehydrogenase [Planctomycetota bacterium]